MHCLPGPVCATRARRWWRRLPATAALQRERSHRRRRSTTTLLLLQRQSRHHLLPHYHLPVMRVVLQVLAVMLARTWELL